MIRAINEVKVALVEQLPGVFNGCFSVEKKQDNTLVTSVDFLISNIVKEVLAGIGEFDGWSFYSEEDHGELTFPAIILDPIDGTAQLARRIPECSISLAFMMAPDISHQQNVGWIYNPFTGFEALSEHAMPNFFLEETPPPYMGMISRSDYRKGLFNGADTNDISFIPKGSIAFKLGLLATGSCDFVLSKTPKNIWDIAAGTIIAERNKVLCFNERGIVKHLGSKRIIGPLIWCSEKKLKSLQERSEVFHVFQS